MATEVLVVRRGMDPDYYRFMQITAHANRTELIVDRRRAERRQDAPRPEVDRRRSDRRADPPPTWSNDGFVALTRP